MNITVKNPYIGPRTFQKEDGDIFFGREREARDLLALIASERLILFYAQSGAGKSSLLNTRIIPELENGNFEVLPVGRVQGDLPPGLEVENVYIYNLMNSMLQQKISPATLAKLSLSEFLVTLDFNDTGYFLDASRTTGTHTELRWRRVLMIDQFEEIFTTHLDTWTSRGGFFQQLAQALNDDPYLTVILIMRDDYIASLDLYAHLLPGGLRTRYYMQRLTKEAALKAVKNPVENIRPYAGGTAEKLVEDLSGIVVYKTGGTQEIQSGQYVEPVQLQVVCYSLWENLPPQGVEITSADLSEVGDVNQSLESFYNHRVATVAKEQNVSERGIREWFDRELITANKTRNMVLQEPEFTAGLRNTVVQSLQGDLVRAELRAGQIWVELSHDRLVEPMLASNAKWFEQNLSMFQRRVVLWTQQDRSESLLLGKQELAEAEKEASALNLTKDEQDFLEESQQQIKRVQRDMTQRRLIFVGFIISLVLLVVAALSYWDATKQRNAANVAKDKAVAAEALAKNAEANAMNSAEEALREKKNAEEQAKIAESEAQKALAAGLAAQADSRKASDHTLALLLGVKAYSLEPNLLTRTTLFDLLQFSPYTRLFGYNGPVSSLAASPDGKLIAASSCREYSNNLCGYGEITLSDAITQQPFSTLPGDYGAVINLAFHQSGDKLLLAAAGCIPVNEETKSTGCTDNRGQITLWDVSDAGKPVLLKSFGEGHRALIKAIAFSHEGSLLASGSFDTRIILWDISDLQNPSAKGSPLYGHASFINSLAFSNDDKTLVSAGDDQNIILWDLSNSLNVKKIGKPIGQHTAPVNTIAFSPDGAKFASASDDTTIILWNWDSTTHTLQENFITLKAHSGYVKSLAFSPDGNVLASAGFDSKVILWNTRTGEQIGLPLKAHTKAINAIAFGNADKPDGSNFLYLLSGGDDRVVIQWDFSFHLEEPLSQPEMDVTPPEGIGTKASSGDLIASVENQQQIKLGERTELLSGHTGAVNSLSFSLQIDNRLLLASASDDQTVILWDVNNIETEPVYLRLEGFENPVALAFFDDIQLVTIEKNSGRTIRWDIRPSIWVLRACDIVNETLTDTQIREWERLVPTQDYQSACQSNE